MKETNKKIIATIIIFAVLFTSFSPIFSRKAEAQWVDWANLIPNTVSGVSGWGQFMKIFLDAVAYQMINLVIQKMTASTVNWINKGFKGSPAFMTNPEAYYGNMADNVVGQFVFGPRSKLNFLCAPIKAKIKIALTKNYLGDNKQWNCSLTQAGKNMDDFMGNFENGGWDSFFEMSQNTTMNPIGAYLQAENEMYLQISTKQGTKKEELVQGNGFLSYRKCKRYAGDASPVAGNTTEGAKKSVCLKGLLGSGLNAVEMDYPPPNYGPVNSSCLQSDILVFTGGKWVSQGSSGRTIEQTENDDLADGCVESEIVTPGSVIQNKLNSVLKIGDNRIGVANAINQMLSALLNQVANQIVGGIGKGLRGMSRPDSSRTNNQSLADQLLAEEQKADTNAYFQRNTETAEAGLDLEPPKTCTPENPDAPECKGPNSGGSDGSSTTRPIDNDCNSLSPSEILGLATTIRDATPGPSNMKPSLEQVITDLDCDPTGIH